MQCNNNVTTVTIKMHRKNSSFVASYQPKWEASIQVGYVSFFSFFLLRGQLITLNGSQKLVVFQNDYIVVKTLM